MQSRKILAGMLFVSLVAAACTKKETAATDTGGAMASTAAPADHTADATTIVQADSAWLRGVMSKNVDSIMVWYTPDAVSYGPGQVPASGTDQMRAMYTEMVKSTATNPKLLSNTVKFSEDGSMAFDHGTYSMTMTAPGGKPENMTGAYLNVWKRMDGKWKLAAEMSTPVPAPK